MKCVNRHVKETMERSYRNFIFCFIHRLSEIPSQRTSFLYEYFSDKLNQAKSGHKIV